MVVEIISIIFYVWVIFLGGAEWLQNTFLGHFEFNGLADNVLLLKIAAMILLIMHFIFIFVN